MQGVCPDPIVTSSSTVNESACLPILYYNARSIIPKFDELCALVEIHSPKLICIVETWLCDNITDSELSIPNYELIRLDRNRHGGGVLIYVHVSLVTDVIVKGPHGLEFLVITVSNTVYKFCIGLFYRPPSSTRQVFEVFCTFLETLNITHFSNFVLLGDFNIDCNTSNNTHHILYPVLSNLMQSFSLTQVVPEATHINPNGTATLIDLALLSTPSLLQSCAIIPPIGNSDHNGFLLRLKWKSSCQQVQSQPRTIWRYAHADFGKACELINSTDWDALIVNHDVNLSLHNWEHPFLQIMDVCIPKGTLPKRQNLPWVSKNVLRAMRKRNRLYKRAKKTGTVTHMKNYKTLRNKVVAMLRANKKLFFNNLNAASQKQFWKTMKQGTKHSPYLVS